MDPNASYLHTPEDNDNSVLLYDVAQASQTFTLSPMPQHISLGPRCNSPPSATSQDYLDNTYSNQYGLSGWQLQPQFRPNYQQQGNSWSPVPWLTAENNPPAKPSLIILPQRQYKARSKDIAHQYIPILFEVEGKIGMPLQDALDGKYSGLLNRDYPMFAGCGSSISVRLEVKGYKSWGRQIKTLDWRKPPKPIMLSKLSTEIAKSVKSFIENGAEEIAAGEADHEPVHWKVGRNGLPLKCLLLRSLIQVSRASWQPELLLDTSHPYVRSQYIEYEA